MATSADSVRTFECIPQMVLTAPPYGRAMII